MKKLLYLSMIFVFIFIFTACSEVVGKSVDSQFIKDIGKDLE